MEVRAMSAEGDGRSDGARSGNKPDLATSRPEAQPPKRVGVPESECTDKLCRKADLSSGERGFRSRFSLLCSSINCYLFQNALSRDDSVRNTPEDWVRLTSCPVEKCGISAVATFASASWCPME